MNTYRTSYLAILALVFLLPIFFIPVLSMPLGVAKVALLTLLCLVGFSALLIDIFRNEEISVPRHALLWGVLVLPLIYFISAFASKTPKLSLFGYGLENGTAASMLLLFALFGVTALVFRDRARLLKGYTALFLSLGILSLFALVKVFFGGDLLVFKNFAGNMGNPVGMWTDYAVIFALLSTLSILVLEMLPIHGAMKWMTYALFAVSLFMLAVINFGTAWVLLLAVSVVLLVYFVTVERTALPDEKRKRRPGVVAAAILGALALVFIFNPVISSSRGTVSNVFAGFFGISNTDVRPTLSTTLDVSRASIRENPVLGSGPNTFGKNWLRYKPSSINNSQFWNVVFPFGVGFIPTQIASTGLLGSFAWALFFILFVILGLSVFARSPEKKTDRFLVISSFITALFLWIATMVYMPSIVILALAFIFTGFFVASAAVTGVIGERVIMFSRSPITHFVAVLIMIILAAGTAAFALAAYQKVSAATHFERALVLSNTPATPIERIEEELVRAINLSPADLFWSALSELELSRANSILNSATGTPAERSEAFQASLARSIAYLQNAIRENPNYQNWRALGDVYASLVPEPLSVEGAYESAQTAYNTALTFNPETPEIALLLARLELANDNVDAARSLINEALAKKSDYADAYFLLTQLEVGENNLREAIKSAETAVVLSPGNAGVLFQLGLLKYSNKDYAGAVGAFKEALVIIPDYANAKYYLGLSLDQLGRKDEALSEFEDLARTNPDNEAVMQVLANLRAGKPALSETSRAGTTRTTPPISGQ